MIFYKILAVIAISLVITWLIGALAIQVFANKSTVEPLPKYLQERIIKEENNVISVNVFDLRNLDKDLWVIDDYTQRGYKYCGVIATAFHGDTARSILFAKPGHAGRVC